MSEQRKEQLKKKLINQIVRVTTKNGRIFQGVLKAVDFRANLVLQECVAEIPQQQNCPLNRHIVNIMDNKLKFTPNPQLSQEQQKRQLQEYMGSHYYIGGVMIAGTDIGKVEMRSPPVQEKKDQGKQKNQKE